MPPKSDLGGCNLTARFFSPTTLAPHPARTGARSRRIFMLTAATFPGIPAPVRTLGQWILPREGTIPRANSAKVDLQVCLNFLAKPLYRGQTRQCLISFRWRQDIFSVHVAGKDITGSPFHIC